MKHIEEHLNDTLNESSVQVNEAKFNIKAIEKQAAAVYKVVKSKPKFNKWYDEEMGGKPDSNLINCVDAIVGTLTELGLELEDNFYDDDEYSGYDDPNFVEEYWNGLWGSWADDYSDVIEEARDVILGLWDTFAKKPFPFEMD